MLEAIKLNNSFFIYYIQSDLTQKHGFFLTTTAENIAFNKAQSVAHSLEQLIMVKTNQKPTKFLKWTMIMLLK